MRICFVRDAHAAQIPEARHALETLALLMGHPVWFASESEALGPEDVPVLVGATFGPERDAAARIPLKEWETWNLADLGLASFEGRPLPCPGGALPHATTASEIPAAWLRSIGFLLAREEEAQNPRRDRWQCFAGNYSVLYEMGVLDRPLVNVAAAELEMRVSAWATQRGLDSAPVPRWKNDARFAVVLSHDVDDLRLRSVYEALRLLGRASWPWSYALRKGAMQLVRSVGAPNAADDPYWRFDQWAAEESKHGFRSTFFVFPPRPAQPHEFDPLYRLDDPMRFEGEMQPFASALRKLAERGFEIGLHASYRSHLSAERLAAEKQQIESAIGRPIAGIRQHFLRFEVPETWRAQAAAHFSYDSTLGYNEALGFRAGIAAPYRPWDPHLDQAMDLLELPLTVMDGTLFRTLLLDGKQAARRTVEQLEIVENVGGLAVLLWHPHGAAEEYFPGWWASYQEVLAYLGGRSVWVATAAEIDVWWRERERKILLR
jgi:peptidoglycan/xylan/chitin deacetylase (PgdA/CDA1 family)